MIHASAVLRVGFVFAIAVLTADAQTTFASITGTVTDPNEAVVPAAVVEAPMRTALTADLGRLKTLVEAESVKNRPGD